jgi:predicted TIM-barrel fold metal-dependent hydrolase
LFPTHRRFILAGTPEVLVMGAEAGGRPRVIDADGHVLDTNVRAIRWEEWLEEPYKARAPRHIPFETGGGRMFLEGQIVPAPMAVASRLGGQTVSADIHQRREGMWLPAPRLADMDLEGIEVSFLFGGAIAIGCSSLPDADFAGALARAYNNWLADFCRADPARLRGVACVALQRPEEAARELRRAVTDLGFRAVAVPPHLNDRRLDHPDFHPFYAAAQELDVAVCVHMLAANIPWLRGLGRDRCESIFEARVITHSFEQMAAVMALTLGGVFDTFPRLRVAFLEGWSGWAPFWLEKLDSAFRLSGEHVRAKRPPMAYFEGGNCFLACELGEQTLPTTAALFEDNLLYASDYWHWDAHFPGEVAEFLEREDLTPRVKEKILGANAARLFNV